jgi:ABC-type phosphate transport system auxiliary subunit
MPSDIVFLIPLLGISVGMIAVTGGVIVRPWLRYKERKLAIEATMVAEKAAQYAAQTERLEQRVRVLERIITDRGMDLSLDIERLRDTPLN